MKKRVIYSVELPLVLPKNMPKFKHKRQLLTATFIVPFW